MPRNKREPRSSQDGADPSARSSEGRQARILEAAIAEFGERGFAGARVDRIAHLARANKQLIYYYFDSKSGLYEAAVKRLIERGHEERATRQLSDLREVLHRLNEPGPLASQGWHRLWLWEALERDYHDILHEDERRRVFGELTRVVERAQEDGVVDAKFDPAMLALAVTAITALPRILPQITKLIVNEDHMGKQFHDRQAELLDQFLAHIAPPSPAARTQARPEDVS